MRALSQYSAQICWLAMLATSGLTVGCSGSGDRPELGFVEGVIQLDGKPLPNATVFFSPEEGGRTSVGITDADGQYNMCYIGNEPGAKIGKHVVRVTTSQEIEDPKTHRTIHTPEKVPDRYNGHSELTHQVEAGQNLVNLDLKSR